MPSFDAKLPSLRDKHREISNEEIVKETEKIKEDIKIETGKVAKKKSK